ncbi:hypothetical protein [Maribacter litopenaei]|uniref:tetratricopeptide repeat protein n=1 Tax=Maribacter litopenaei TaxID=2976127 RepID=UPI003083FA40
MLKKVHILFLIIIFQMASGISFAQERFLKKGDEKYEEYSFSPAIDIYKKVLDKGFVSADLLRKLGNSYYFNADYKEAGKIYNRLVTEFQSEVTAEDYFKYAQTLKSLEDYDRADEIMGKFTEMTSNDVRAKQYKSMEDYLADIKKNSVGMN